MAARRHEGIVVLAISFAMLLGTPGIADAVTVGVRGSSTAPTTSGAPGCGTSRERPPFGGGPWTATTTSSREARTGTTSGASPTGHP